MGVQSESAECGVENTGGPSCGVGVFFVRARECVCWMSRKDGGDDDGERARASEDGGGVCEGSARASRAAVWRV